MTSIRDAQPGDRDAWRTLWDGYNTFYQQNVPERVTAATWGRILEAKGIGCIVATAEGGEVVGFANFIVHAHTWGEFPACYLEDLFVTPGARSGGAGRALIEHLIERGRTEPWDYVYWHTRNYNAVARRLYDTFASCDDDVKYVVPIEPRASALKGVAP